MCCDHARASKLQRQSFTKRPHHRRPRCLRSCCDRLPLAARRRPTVNGGVRVQFSVALVWSEHTRKHDHMQKRRDAGMHAQPIERVDCGRSGACLRVYRYSRRDRPPPMSCRRRHPCRPSPRRWAADTGRRPAAARGGSSSGGRAHCRERCAAHAHEPDSRCVCVLVHRHLRIRLICLVKSVERSHFMFTRVLKLI